MPKATTRELMARASEAHTVIPSFNIPYLPMMEPVDRALQDSARAERAVSPVNDYRRHGPRLRVVRGPGFRITFHRAVGTTSWSRLRRLGRAT